MYGGEYKRVKSMHVSISSRLSAMYNKYKAPIVLQLLDVANAEDHCTVIYAMKLPNNIPVGVMVVTYYKDGRGKYYVFETIAGEIKPAHQNQKSE